MIDAKMSFETIDCSLLLWCVCASIVDQIMQRKLLLVEAFDEGSNTRKRAEIEWHQLNFLASSRLFDAIQSRLTPRSVTARCSKTEKRELSVLNVGKAWPKTDSRTNDNVGANLC